MPNYPEPGNLANANGLSFPGVAAFPGGVVYGRDGQVIREMLAATSTILGGDAVILAPSLASLSPYFVARTSVTDSPLRYGIVVGGRVGSAVVSAASLPVWVAIEGPAWANAGASVSIGDLVGTTSLVAGAVAKSIGANNPTLRSYAATVSFATSITSTGGGVYYIDVSVAQGAPFTSLDIPVNFIPTVSLTANLAVGAVWPDSSVTWGIRLIGVNVSTTIASQASIPGTLITALASQPVAGAILGAVLTSTSAVSIPTLIHVDKR